MAQNTPSNHVIEAAARAGAAVINPAPTVGKPGSQYLRFAEAAIKAADAARAPEIVVAVGNLVDAAIAYGECPSIENETKMKDAYHKLLILPDITAVANDCDAGGS